MEFDFNQNIPVNIFQSRRLRQILLNKFWCILTARYNHCLYRIDLRAIEIDGQLSFSPTSLATAQPDGSIALNIVSEPLLLSENTVADSSVKNTWWYTDARALLKIWLR